MVGGEADAAVAAGGTGGPDEPAVGHGAERDERGQSDGIDTGQSPQAVEHRRVDVAVTRLVVAGQRRIQFGDEAAVEAEAGIRVGRLERAAQEQPAGGEQCERE